MPAFFHFRFRKRDIAFTLRLTPLPITRVRRTAFPPSSSSRKDKLLGLRDELTRVIGAKQTIRRIALKRCADHDREVGRQPNPAPRRNPQRRTMKTCRAANSRPACLSGRGRDFPRLTCRRSRG